MALGMLTEAAEQVRRLSPAHTSEAAKWAPAPGGIRQDGVEDDGSGIPVGGRRSGLRNLAERAEALGGTFSTRDGALGGTVLLWRVPLH